MIRRAAFIPTGRAALLVAAAAPLALLLAVFVPGSWAAAPVLGTLIIGLVVIDALLAGRVLTAELTVQADVEVGEEGWLEALELPPTIDYGAIGILIIYPLALTVHV